MAPLSQPVGQSVTSVELIHDYLQLTGTLRSGGNSVIAGFGVMRSLAMSLRGDLIGRKVMRAERDCNGIGLLLEGEWKVAVWAKADVHSVNGHPCEVEQIVGARLISFEGDPEAESFGFDNGCELRVQLRTAPVPAESMALYAPRGPVVVWE